MKFTPFERWVTLREAPDLHQDTEAKVTVGGKELVAVQKAVSYSRRTSEPNTGRWYRVIEVAEDLPPYFGPGTPVVCNLSMLSDNLTIGDEDVALMPFSQCAGIRIGTETMAHLGTRHPVIPIGDYVLCVDNDEKHKAILGLKTSLHTPLSTLARGQRTDEQYENHKDEFGETPNPNRENDGVRMMFSEVVEVGPDVPANRKLQKGDMVAFRAQCSGIKFDLFGVSYRLVRCSERNSEVVGKVPACEFS